MIIARTLCSLSEAIYTKLGLLTALAYGASVAATPKSAARKDTNTKLPEGFGEFFYLTLDRNNPV